MLGVLHLHPPRCDFQTQRCLEILFKDAGSGAAMTSISIGPGGKYQNLLEAIFRLRCAGYDQTHIVHAWGPAELLAAAAAGFSNLVFSPQARIHPKWWKWIELILRNRDVRVVCPTLFVQRTFISHGANPDRCRVIYPAVDAGRLNGTDPEIRARLGLAETDLVLLAAGESFRDASHTSALWAAAILNFLNPRYRLLVWGRGPMVESMRRFARVAASDHLLVTAESVIGGEIDFEQIVPAADMVLFCARSPSPILPLGVCLSAGLPVVASESAETREFLQDDVNALVEPSVNPRCLAQRVRELQNDPSARQRLAQAAHSTGADRFSVATFCEEWRNVYSAMNGKDASRTMVSRSTS
jgi:glycosyltransferase involved in cell wall biosynthesis